MDSDSPKPVPVYPGQSFTPPAPLSDAEIGLIHAGLAIPSAASIHSMAREIRKWRDVPDPDEI